MIRRACTLLAAASLLLFVVSLAAAIWASIGDDARFVARHGKCWQFKRGNGTLGVSTRRPLVLTVPIDRVQDGEPDTG